MSRMIRIRSLGQEESTVVPLKEAEETLDRLYNDPIGGLVMDAKTKKVIWRIGPEVEEIVILEQMLGGG